MVNDGWHDLSSVTLCTMLYFSFGGGRENTAEGKTSKGPVDEKSGKKVCIVGLKGGSHYTTGTRFFMEYQMLAATS